MSKKGITSNNSRKEENKVEKNANTEAVTTSEKTSRYSYRTVKYKPDQHLCLLGELLANGEHIVAFCVEVGIVKSTFYEWLNKYPEFKLAYEIGTMASQLWWERYGRDNITASNFNYSVWSSIMRHRFGYTEHRKLQIASLDKMSTPAKQFMLLLKEVAEGNLTAAELNQASNAILTGAKIEEMSELKRRIQALELKYTEDTSTEEYTEPSTRQMVAV